MTRGRLTAGLFGGLLVGLAGGVLVARVVPGTRMERLIAGALVTEVLWVGSTIAGLAARSGRVAWSRAAAFTLLALLAVALTW